MLEQLLTLVQEQAQNTIVSNPAIPNERNEEAISEVSGNIAAGLQQAMASGHGADVLRLLSGKGGDVASNPVAQDISGNTIQALMNKFGLNSTQAGSIVSQLLPSVLQQFISKTNNPNDNSINLQGILSELTGGAAGGLDVQGLVNKLSQGGLDRDGDGDVDLQDALHLLKGGAGQQQQGSGGLANLVKGLFGK
ncbi:MAG TPA: hypothetical protein PKE63_04275 [Lacibacter sp.]|nr:hypothetical protein [Lacibacter sp.]HMO88081.1 hypothetical protein [Lacibacter sp.]HMP86467.1 hypothetical protein [Lacibacter sp.]